MRARLIEQYELILAKREMDELMQALRTYVREFDASPLAEQLLAELDEIHTGPRLGVGVELVETPLDPDSEGGEDVADGGEGDEGGTRVPA